MYKIFEKKIKDYEARRTQKQKKNKEGKNSYTWEAKSQNEKMMYKKFGTS